MTDMTLSHGDSFESRDAVYNENPSSEESSNVTPKFEDKRRPAITLTCAPERSMGVPDVLVDDTKDSLITDFGRETLRERYLTEGETIQDRFANCVRYYANDKDHADRMYTYISNLWCMPSTPILSNGGTVKGNLISCFVNEMEDSLKGIVKTWNENIWLGALGGGIGTYVGNLRSIGEEMKLNGKTSGAISFTKVIDALTACISQGSMRRGSAAVYMDIHHPEIDSFLDMRKQAGGDPDRKTMNLHHGVIVDDVFMNAVENNEDYDLISPKTGKVVETVRAQDLAAKLLETRIATGEPYILFKDNIAKHVPAHHKRSGLYPKTSNLCVAPETRVLTIEGYKEIQSISGTFQKVWNGKKWSEAYVDKTGENQKLVSVYLSNGVKLQVTPYHKWKLQLGYGHYNTNTTMVRTSDLKPGDKLFKVQFSPIEGGFSEDPLYAYINGFYSADGTSDGHGNPRVYLYGEKKSLLDIFELAYPKRVSLDEAGGTRHAVYYEKDCIAPKYTVPLDCDLKTRLHWLSGYLDGDGTVCRIGDTETIQCASINKEFLLDIRLLLNTLGVDGKIALNRVSGVYNLPNGNGGLTGYNCSDVYRLIITAGDTQRLLDLGLVCNRLNLTKRVVQRDAAQFVTVVDVIDEGRYDDTYCFNEPEEHLGVFEGILTGNCAEILLPTGKDHHGVDRTAVCCLFQLNLEKRDEWTGNYQFFKDIGYFLDNVLQDFIDNGGEEFVNPRYSASRERSIGVGVMGFHSYLQSKNIPYESVMAKVWNKRIFTEIHDKMDEVSRELAEERGACPDAAEYGMMERFSYKTAIAPTASVSIICGGASAGIDIIPANVYTHKTLSGSFEVRNKYLEKLLEEKGFNTKEIWKSILKHEGSVQHLEFLDDHEKLVFKTSFETDQRYNIELAADRAPLINQSQSLNVAIRPDCHKRDLWKLHQMAWKLGVKTMYYLRSISIQKSDLSDTIAKSNVTEIYRPIDYDTCTSCQ